ncbi:MAG: hypothetical protein M0004_03625 [Actinomycetota bacterium]|nr:hypothetical protein [Actinomycetota bacterium]
MLGDQPGEERKALFEQVLEFALYVPLGAALKVAEQVPELAAAGRSVAGRQIDNARVIGRVAVGAARRTVGARTGARTTGNDPSAATPSAAPPRAPRAAPDRSTPSRTEPDAPAPSAAAEGAALAIAGYDTLAASQIVPLLAGLSGPELADIRRHEEANRHRRTVLGRIAQLQEERGHGA